MQKKLIALAVAGLASGAAFAQTNVTIYGVADATFESASATGAAGAPHSSATGNDLDRGAFTRVNTNSSLIGFKGEEALGNGLKAIFQFESVASFDSAGALSLARDSFVGLGSDKFGTVKLGNLTTPTRALGAAVDMNAGATGPGANASLIGKVLGGNAIIAGTSIRTVAGGGYAIDDVYNNGAAGYNSGFFDTRMTNAIAYASPVWSGFQVGAAYKAGEDKSLNSNDNTTRKVNTYGYDLGATYTNGPIFAGLTYGKVNSQRDRTYYSGCAASAPAATISCAADESSIWRLAGKYTFNGGHQIAALYEQNRADLNWAADDHSSIKQRTWGIGGKFMATPALALIGQYYKQNDAKISNNDPDGDTSAHLWELGLEYSLSKRTMLKASYSQLNNGADVANDFNVGAVGGGFGVGSKLQVWSAGIRHTF